MSSAAGPPREGLRVRPAGAAAALDAVLEGLVDGGVVPGGAAAVVTATGIPYRRVFGDRAVEPVREPATAGTWWDLASLTKPLCTATLCLVLRRRGVLRFDEPATRLLPELDGPPHRPPTIGELLTHAAGLPAWVPLRSVAPGGLVELARWLAPPREAPGVRAVYGCPAYLLLGLALERATGSPLRELARGLLWPGRDDVAFPLPAELRGEAAPTERGNAFERRLALESGFGDVGGRTGLIRGEVHDGNAHGLGGAAGNAGMFATIGGAAWLAQRYLRGSDLLDREDLDELSRAWSPDADDGEIRTWGFQLARSRNSPAGEALGDRAFGHAGFTGTSLFVDPDRGAAYVLLTNRVHPEWREHAFHADRRRFHAAAAALADALAVSEREGVPAPSEAARG